MNDDILNELLDVDEIMDEHGTADDNLDEEP